jgi:hypothetical protein
MAGCRALTGRGIRADWLEVLPNVFMPVASTGHLIALKALAGRHQDLTDLGYLIAAASGADLDEATAAAARIEERGFNTRAGAGNPMNDYIFSNLAAKAQNWATLDAVRDIADKNGLTPSQVAYSWVANRPGVTAPIMGAKTLDQLEQNLIAGDFVLGDDETARLDEISTPSPGGYPYGPFAVKQRDRYIDFSDQAIKELF